MIGTTNELFGTRALHFESIPVSYTNYIFNPFNGIIIRMPTISLPYQVSTDASFRHRNGRAQGASVIQSVELLDRNDRDHKTVVHDMISVCRRDDADIPFAVVCAFARDGQSCYTCTGRRKSGRRRLRREVASEMTRCQSTVSPAPLFRSLSRRSWRRALERRSFAYGLCAKASW